MTYVHSLASPVVLCTVWLILALPMLGSALGGPGISVLHTPAVLACPIGMAVMMWLMMRAQQAGTCPPAQACAGPTTLAGPAGGGPLPGTGRSAA